MKINKETIKMLCKFLTEYIDQSVVRQSDIEYIKCFVNKVENMDEYDMTAEEEREIILDIICLVECCPYDVWNKEELTLFNNLGLGKLLERVSIGDF